MDSKSRWSQLKNALLNTKPNGGEIIKYKVYTLDQGIKVKIESEEKDITRDELLTACQNEVDNTGNVKVWPAEECLANFLITNSYLFEEKRVCELGAGMSGLAAIALAIKLKDKIGEIMISDGNEHCCRSIKKAILLNRDEIGEENMARITVKQIIWDESIQLSENKYDYICIAECLFFRKFHKALEHTLAELLEDSDEEGRVFIMGPNRSNTMCEFIEHLNQDEMFEHTVEEMDENHAEIEEITSPSEIIPQDNSSDSDSSGDDGKKSGSDSDDSPDFGVALPEIDTDGSDKYIPTLDLDSDPGTPSSDCTP